MQSNSVIPDRDEVYSYDGLDRLTEAERGHYDHDTPAWTDGKRSQKWDLDPLGNWKRDRIDLGGDGSYGGAADFEDVRLHVAANEIGSRGVYDARVGMTSGPGGVGEPGADDELLTLGYDDAGNLVSQQRLVPDGGGWAVVEWRYVYDAWNRLVEVKVDPDAGGEDPAQVRVRYGYNGLHWRVWRIADEDFDEYALPDAANLYYYDAMWRLLEEHVRGDFGGGATWANTAPGSSGDLLKITQRFWCPHYIDDLIAWQTQSGYDDSGWVEPEGDFQDSDALHYALTDRLHSVIGVLDGVGAGYPLRERVRYGAYGVARNIPRSDTNGDGVVNSADASEVLARYGKGYGDGTDYAPDADFNQDGMIDFAEYSAVLGESGFGVPEGALSLPGVGNTIGYTGHHFDPATGMTLARHRWLEHDLGRYSPTCAARCW